MTFSPLYPSAKENIQVKLQEIRQHLDKFEATMPNLSQRGYDQLLNKWLRQMDTSAFLLTEDLKIALEVFPTKQ